MSYHPTIEGNPREVDPRINPKAAVEILKSMLMPMPNPSEFVRVANSPAGKNRRRRDGEVFLREGPAGVEFVEPEQVSSK